MENNIFSPDDNLETEMNPMSGEDLCNKSHQCDVRKKSFRYKSDLKRPTPKVFIKN